MELRESLYYYTDVIKRLYTMLYQLYLYDNAPTKAQLNAARELIDSIGVDL